MNSTVCWPNHEQILHKMIIAPH